VENVWKITTEIYRYIIYFVLIVGYGYMVFLISSSYKTMSRRGFLIMVGKMMIVVVATFVLIFGLLMSSIGYTFFTFVPDHPQSVFYFYAAGVLIGYYGSRRLRLEKTPVSYLIGATVFAIVCITLYFCVWLTPVETPTIHWTDRGAIKFSVLAGLIIAYGTTLFIVVSEIMERGMARYLTVHRGENWTKEIDYIYLGFGAVGAIMSLNRISGVAPGFTGSDIIAPVLVTTAVVLRLMKTRAEIAEWNKKSAFHGSPAT
jgi:hypothetical protein